MTELETTPLHPQMAHEAPLAYDAQQVEDAVTHASHIRIHVDEAVMQYAAVGGGIDQRGFIKNLTKKGFTQYQCWCELLANSIDNQATMCQIMIKHNTINLIDNGCGMQKSKLEEMFQMFRENHPNQRTIGLAGVGAKPALYILSNQQTCYVYTRAENGAYLKATIPWKDMIEQGQWTDMIIFTPQTEDEKEEYIRERIDRHMDIKGTTIVLPYTDTVAINISNQFNKITREKIQPIERFDIVFAKINNWKVIFTHCDNPQAVRELEMFRPLSYNNSEYYLGITRNKICVYRDTDTNETYFVLDTDDGPKYCRKTGRGVDKQPQPYTLGTPTLIGEIVLKLAMKKNNNYFDPDHPKKPTCNALRLDNYEKIFFPAAQTGQVSHKEFLAKRHLFRNKHMFGTTSHFKFSSFNGGGAGQVKSKHKNFYIKQELHYDTRACQDNPMDKIFGIQENKNQFNGKCLPKTLTNILDYCKNEKATQMWEYFIQLSDAAAAAPVATPPATTDVVATTLAAAGALVDAAVAAHVAATAELAPLPPGDALEAAQLGALAAVAAAPVDVNVVIPSAADDEGVVAAAPAPPSIAAADDDDDNEPTITDGMASVSDVNCLLLTITQQLDRQKIYEMFKLATDQQNDQQNLQELITLSKDLLCS
jgi:hypothetical protein